MTLEQRARAAVADGAAAIQHHPQTGVTRRDTMAPRHTHNGESKLRVCSQSAVTSATNVLDWISGTCLIVCFKEILCFPIELIEMLLMSVSCLLGKVLLKTHARPDVQIFLTLASVCSHFYTVLTKRRWFAKTLKRQLTGENFLYSVIIRCL